jgi:pimeloyl-ACP methyl ester carboxylesterase
MRLSLRGVLFALGGAALMGVGVVVFDFAFLRGQTPGIKGPRSVVTLAEMQIGGVEQWVLIRGHDRTKPILLFLHGGPGMPVMYLAHAFQRELERDFVVVHWDRRGAGKSFDARRQRPALSVSQTLEDTYELTRHLRARFGHQQIYLVGHSWGSYLGLLAIRGHPEYYRAFIGMGQIAGDREQVRLLRQGFLAERARATDDSELLARVTSADFDVTEDDLFRYGGELYGAQGFWPILLTGLRAPEYTFRDAMNVKKGADLVGRDMNYDIVPRPLVGELLKLDVPVFFFVGRHDFNTPSQLAAEYLDRLDAPLKEVVWFESSAHFPFFEEPDRFRNEVLRVEVAVNAFWKDRSGREASGPPAAAAEQPVAAVGAARRR